jgi:hypothetical protein
MEMFFRLDRKVGNRLLGNLFDLPLKSQTTSVMPEETCLVVSVNLFKKLYCYQQEADEGKLLNNYLDINVY